MSDFAASELTRKPLLHTRGICRARSFDLEVTPWAPTRLTSYISHIGPEESCGASTLSQAAQERPGAISPPRNRPASLNCGDEQRVGHEQLPRSGRGSGEAAKFSTGHSGRPGTTLIYLALRLMSRERKPAGSPTSHFLDWHRRARINPRPVRLGTAQSSWLRRSGTSLYLMRLHFPTHPVDDGSRSLTSRQGRRQAAAKTRLHKDLHIKWF